MGHTRRALQLYRSIHEGSLGGFLFFSPTELQPVCDEYLEKDPTQIIIDTKQLITKDKNQTYAAKRFNSEKAFSNRICSISAFCATCPPGRMLCALFILFIYGYLNILFHSFIHSFIDKNTSNNKYKN